MKTILKPIQMPLLIYKIRIFPNLKSYTHVECVECTCGVCVVGGWGVWVRLHTDGTSANQCPQHKLAITTHTPQYCHVISQLFSAAVYNALTETGRSLGTLVTCGIIAIRVRVVNVGCAILIGLGSMVAMVVGLAASRKCYNQSSILLTGHQQYTSLHPQ